MEYEVDNLLNELSQIDGILRVAVINNINKKIERSINMDGKCDSLVQAMSDVVRANMKYSRLSSKRNEIEDVLITYCDEIHLLKPLIRTARYFIYISILRDANIALTREGANKQVISSQADSLIKISRIWADFFPANT
ncbi:hypothetical protein U0868_21320, partial [Kluyvera ascorbata]|uniref:hypothetical protein n=1 Tax=Kluyvera ascorbata TaxID=51288 RepID=UPI002AB871D9